MSITSKQQTETQTTDKQGTQRPNMALDPRLAKIQKMVDNSTKFNEDANQRVVLKLNIPEVILFPADFYIDYDDLYNEAINVHKKQPKDAAEYAENNYRVKRNLENDSTNKTRTYPQTTYKVQLPNSTFPHMIRDFKMSSKGALDELNKKLLDVATKHDGAILVTVLKKQTGESKFNIKWEINAVPA